MMKRFLIAAVCSLFWIASADAQTCTGLLPFAKAPLQVGALANFSSNSHAFVPAVGFGNDAYFFRAGAEFTSFSGVDAGAKGIFGLAAAEYKVEASKPLFVCPFVSLIKNWGPSVENGFDNSSWLLGLGGTVGFEASKAGQATIVPTFSLSFNHLSTTSTLNFGPNPFSDSFGSSFGSVQFGVGFIFNDRMSLLPAITVPFGLDGGETSFSVLFAIKAGQ